MRNLGQAFDFYGSHYRRSVFTEDRIVIPCTQTLQKASAAQRENEACFTVNLLPQSQGSHNLV